MMRTAIALLAAYLLATAAIPLDVPAGRGRLLRLCARVVAVAVLSSCLLLGWSPEIVIAVAAGQLVTDLLTLTVARTLAPAIVDLGVHISLIAILASRNPELATRGWSHLSPTVTFEWIAQGLCILCAVCAALPIGDYLVGRLMNPLAPDVAFADIAGLEEAAAYIGRLERALILMFVLIDQPAGVGFLITAKSILRFGDVKDSNQRKATEYVIIGTFASFGWGLLVAILTKRGLALLSG